MAFQDLKRNNFNDKPKENKLKFSLEGINGILREILVVIETIPPELGSIIYFYYCNPDYLKVKMQVKIARINLDFFLSAIGHIRMAPFKEKYILESYTDLLKSFSQVLLINFINLIRNGCIYSVYKENHSTITEYRLFVNKIINYPNYSPTQRITQGAAPIGLLTQGAAPSLLTQGAAPIGLLTQGAAPSLLTQGITAWTGFRNPLPREVLPEARYTCNLAILNYSKHGNKLISVHWNVGMNRNKILVNLVKFLLSHPIITQNFTFE